MLNKKLKINVCAKLLTVSLICPQGGSRAIKDAAEAKGIPWIIITQADGSTDITDIVTAS